jgi:hypothetical protein
MKRACPFHVEIAARDQFRGTAAEQRHSFGTKSGPKLYPLPIRSALSRWNISRHIIVPGRIMHAVLFGD